MVPQILIKLKQNKEQLMLIQNDTYATRQTYKTHQKQIRREQKIIQIFIQSQEQMQALHNFLCDQIK